MKNPTLLQCFHWYYPTGGELWREVEALAPNLNEIGINMVWLPPAYKGASGGYSVGYDCYDLFDLGEFDQKGSVATKYGDKDQLLAAISALRQHDIAVLLDVVVNHKMGADEKSRYAFSALIKTIVRKSLMRLLSARPGRVTPSPPAPVNTLNSSGTISASAGSII